MNNMEKIYNNSCETLSSCGVSEDGYIDEDVIDIRASHQLEGASGAEAFFCDETVCLIEKAKILANAGLADPLINQIQKVIEEKISNIHFCNEQIAEHELELHKKRNFADEQKAALATLLMELEYSNIRFVKIQRKTDVFSSLKRNEVESYETDYVIAAKNGNTFDFGRK